MFPETPQRSFLNPQAIARLAAIPLFARRPMVGSVSGMHASPHRGASVEFAEYRRYVPGDDPRRLDWRAYGRTDRYYVKEFEADTNLRLCLVVDTSGSMGFQSTGIRKLDYALRLAGSLALLTIQQGDAVGLTCIGGQRMEHLPPRRTPSHLRAVLDTLEDLHPSGPTELVERLHEFAETTPQRALVVILSDFFLSPRSLRSALDHLRFRQHDVALFQLLDPQEVQFDFRRPVRFVDLESETAVMADPSEIASEYRAALAQHQRELETTALEAAVDLQTISTQQNDEQALREFLTRRARGRRIR